MSPVRGRLHESTDVRIARDELGEGESVPQIVGYIKGKSAIHIARRFLGRKQTSSSSISG